MITSQQADAIISQQRFLTETEWVPLAAARGRYLRRSILADRAIPPFDRVMMDGIAVSSESIQRGIRTFPLQGVAYAGEPKQVLNNPEAAIRIMTGAVLPENTSTIIPLEDYQEKDSQIHLNSGVEVKNGQFVHRMGSDFGRGYVLVEAGRVLTSPEIAVAASNGKTELEVSLLPRVALVATGDELVDVGDRPEPFQLRRSNTYALQALIERSGLGQVSLHHFADDEARLSDGLATVLDRSEIVIISGGISKGEKDFIPGVLSGLGVDTKFHGVAQRPGKPFYFGTRPSGPVVFGLPGNPVSTLVGGHRYVFPFLEGVMGRRPEPPPSVSLGEAFEFPFPLTCFLPVQLSPEVGAIPRPVKNSGDYARIVPTDGFLELPAEATHFSKGASFPFFSWR